MPDSDSFIHANKQISLAANIAPLLEEREQHVLTFMVRAYRDNKPDLERLLLCSVAEISALRNLSAKLESKAQIAIGEIENG